MILLRITEAKALGEFRLQLRLTDGSVVEREISRLLAGPVFDRIRNDSAQFARVRAAHGTIEWPGEIDLCPDVVIWGGPPRDGTPPKILQIELPSTAKAH